MGSYLSRRFGCRAPLILLLVSLPALQAQAPHPSILGEWHGTSICTKETWNSGCNDETTVYVFTATGSADSVISHGYKQVASAYVSMGDLALAFHAPSGQWRGEFSNSRVHILIRYEAGDSALTGQVVDLLTERIVRQVTARRASGAKLPAD